MKRFGKTVLFLAFIAIALVAVCGCVSPGSYRRSEKQYKYPIELMPSEHALARSGSAYQQGEEFVIAGKIRRSVKACCEPITGHVDIMLTAPEGTITGLVNADFSPRNIPKAGTRSSSFEVRLPFIPAEGTKISLKFHDRKIPSESKAYARQMQSCQENITGGIL